MNKQTSARLYPQPSEIKDIPGTEGWEDMYPYFTRTQPGDDEKFISTDLFPVFPFGDAWYATVPLRRLWSILHREEA